MYIRGHNTVIFMAAQYYPNGDNYRVYRHICTINYNSLGLMASGS